MRRWTSVLIIIAILSLPVLFFVGDFEQTPGPSVGPHVALIELDGIIADTVGTIRPKQTVSYLRRAQDDPMTRAVVIRIDSGGGSPAASQEIYDEIRRTSDSGKPVIISMGDTAASGGYYIAAAGDYILANPATVTASIGVITQYQVYEELLENWGIATHTYTTGQHKAFPNPFEEPTEANVQLWRQLMDDLLDQFVTDVAEGRNLPKEDVHAVADGRVMTGRQALEHGLVDQLGGLEDAIAVAGRMAGIEGRPRVVTLRKEQTWQERLLDWPLIDWSFDKVAERFGIRPEGYRITW